MLLTTVASRGSVESNDISDATIGDREGVALNRAAASEAIDRNSRTSSTITPAAAAN